MLIKFSKNPTPIPGFKKKPKNMTKLTADPTC